MTARQRLEKYAPLVVVTTSLYALSTLLFSAMVVGDTYDEPIYRDAGDVYLRWGDFHTNIAHPPLSKWLGALLPHAFALKGVFWYRVAHCLIFVIGGVLICAVLLWAGRSIAALGVAWLLFLSPTHKAMASLHVNDADLSVFVGLSVAVAWLTYDMRHQPGSRFAPGIMWGFVSGALAGCAAATKVSGLIAAPASLAFLTIAAEQREQWRGVVRVGSSYILGFLLAMITAYHFHLEEIAVLYLETIENQFEHNRDGHKAYLLGRFSELGFWYYYPVTFSFKTPIPELLLVVGSFLVSKSRWRHAVLLVPAATLVFGLTASNVHLGLRYALPALLLAYLFAAVQWEDAWAQPHSPTRRISRLGAAAAAVALLVVDVHTVTQSSYLTFFNTLAPQPTRNFADSVIDWGQGVPLHLQEEASNTVDILDRRLSSLLLTNFPIRMAMAPNQINGLMSTRGTFMRALQPTASVAQIELFELSPLQVWEIFQTRDQGSWYATPAMLQKEMARDADACPGGLTPVVTTTTVSPASLPTILPTQETMVAVLDYASEAATLRAIEHAGPNILAVDRDQREVRAWFINQPYPTQRPLDTSLLGAQARVVVATKHCPK